MESLNPFKLIVLVCGLACMMLACSAPKEKQGGEENTEDATQVADSTQAEEVATTADWTQAEALVMNCGGTAMNLADPIREIADNLTRDSLMYDVKPFSDCSGTFHRVLDSLKKRCDDYPYPDKNNTATRVHLAAGITSRATSSALRIPSIRGI
ncbi:MAG: hypothetical protein D6730_24930 [Bacteroidetes bacterium]|nr:MAG: hypothetical protein D6730_24930 [Bacteroidota bacterium]